MHHVGSDLSRTYNLMVFMGRQWELVSGWKKWVTTGRVSHPQLHSLFPMKWVVLLFFAFPRPQYSITMSPTPMQQANHRLRPLYLRANVNLSFLHHFSRVICCSNRKLANIILYTMTPPSNEECREWTQRFSVEVHAPPIPPT